jgi:hypothetical protein
MQVMRVPMRPLTCVTVAVVAISAGCVQRYDVDKPGVPVEQQRVDWGLCGGDFLPLGKVQIAREKSDAVLRCLSEKGYTIEPTGLLGW